MVIKKIEYLLLGLLVVSVCTNLYLYINSTQKDTIIYQQKKDESESNKALKQSKERINSLQEQQQMQLKRAVDQLHAQQSTPSAFTENTTSLFLSATTSDLTPTKKVMTFWIKGPQTIPFDAVDLGLIYSNIKNVPICTTGKTFPLYPLVKTTQLSLVITGVAKISGDSIQIGSNSESFASCTFEKDDSSQKAIVHLDTERSHIYSLGKSMLDTGASNIYLSW